MSAFERSEESSFQRDYAAALQDYLLEPGEGLLRTAYELGRQAVSRQLSVLDLAVAHQEALSSVLAEALDAAGGKTIVRGAGDFFLESLASFEMVQRGLTAAREALLLERRQTELSRQLSTFLADASLALDASDSLEEMLRLVAEQARELLGAECCVVTLTAADQLPAAAAASHPEGDRNWTALVRWLDLPAIYRFIRLGGGSVRIAGEQLAAASLFSSGERSVHGWLAASLSKLDGGPLGAVQLFDKHSGVFSADDEAALVHLSQMASAAVERARLYQPPG